MAYPQVVRIFATTQEPDYECPWQSLAPSSSTGSGVILGQGRILTGAHVVARATFLQVQRISDPDKVVARVLSVCHDSDLALLQVDDPAFDADVPETEFGGLPQLHDDVMVVGYPVGGEEISVTQGVVSRIEVQRYEHSQRYLLAVTVDAAINSGNSGGPVYQQGKVVGIAFQSLRDAENIGEIVPMPVIEQFLKGAETSTAPPVPGYGLWTQAMENPFLRQRHGLRDGQSGVLLTAVEYGGSGHGRLQAGDVLLEVDGHPVANNGTIRFRDRVRTGIEALLTEHQVGDTVPVRYVRQGEEATTELTMEPLRGLVGRSRYAQLPRYFVWGGLVFQPLTTGYLQTWNKWWERAPQRFVDAYYNGVGTEERQELVVLTQVLADELTVGYEQCDVGIIESVNGEAPRDLADFVFRLETCTGPVTLVNHRRDTIMLDPAQVAAARDRILERYRIPVDRSPTL